MDRALELGINFFDTANIYGGFGGTETIIGNWLQQGMGGATRSCWPPRSTESPPIHRSPTRKWASRRTRCASTLPIRCGACSRAHRPLPGAPHRPACHGRRVLGHLRAPGDQWRRHLHGEQQLPRLGAGQVPDAEALQRGFLAHLEQTQYNLLSRYPELEVIPAAHDLGIGILAYMPLGGGLLTGKARAI